MSYRIEYDFQAFVLHESITGLSEPVYVLAVLGGDNNVYSAIGKGRSRRWSAISIGSHEEVMKEVCYFASAMEGGSLVMYNNRKMKAEGYIKKIRNVLKEAHEGLNFVSSNGMRYVGIGFNVSLYEDKVKEIEKENPELHKELMSLKNTETTRYGGKCMEWRFSGEEIKSLFKLSDLFKRVGAWSIVNVNGRGEV